MADQPLPFAPEPVEDLRARYPRAVARLFRPSRSRQPGASRDHVFDSPDGLRLVVHRTHPKHWPHMLHLEARAVLGTKLGIDLATGAIARDQLAQWALDRFRAIGGDGDAMRIVGWSDDGVATFLDSDETEDACA